MGLGKVVCVVCLLITQAPAQAGFWDRQNTLTVITLGAATGTDAWATERGFQDPTWQEHNPLIPHSTAGRVGYFAGTYAAGVVGAWVLHKTGHPRLARWALRIHLGVEVQAAAWSAAHP